jgi:hypothetical protein
MPASHTALPRPWPMLSGRRRLLGLGLWVSLACASNPSWASAVILGGVGIGGSSQWQAEGRILSTTGDFGNVTWSYSGDASATHTNAVDPLEPGTSYVKIEHVVESSPFAQAGQRPTLKSSSRVDAFLNNGFSRTFARGWSTATITDTVYVMPLDNTFTRGSISFEWQVDGRQLFSVDTVQGVGAPLNSGRQGDLEWAALLQAQTFVLWRDPNGSAFSGSDVQQTFELNEVDTSSVPLTDLQQGALEDLKIGQMRAAREIFPQGVDVYAYRPHSDVDEPAHFNDIVDAHWGRPIEITLGLATSYNLLWDLDDFGLLNATAYSDFGHTAELMSVRLYNEDGTPFVGQWTLQSQQGIDYPEFIATGDAGGPLPLPGTWALSVAALAVLGRVRRRAGRR